MTNKDDMHKELQNTVCFNMGRRHDGPPGTFYLTLPELLLGFAVLFILVYALDAAMHQLAVRVLVPWLGIE
ncbi:MAG: hypothetical protein AB7V08_08695 [Elusimicrobiales bacterium]